MGIHIKLVKYVSAHGKKYAKIRFGGGLFSSSDNHISVDLLMNLIEDADISLSKNKIKKFLKDYPKHHHINEHNKKFVAHLMKKVNVKPEEKKVDK